MNITEQWLCDCGFRWTQIDRQPHKHWLLWLNLAAVDSDESEHRRCISAEDLGIELMATDVTHQHWNCWVRADYCGRYCRFVHVRHLNTTEAVVALIEALTGRSFFPQNVYYGAFRTTEDARRMRKDDERRLERSMAIDWGKRVENETGADPAKRELLRP